MHRLTFFIVFSLFTHCAFAQGIKSQPILVNERHYTGVIFPSDYKVSFRLGLENLTNRFTPPEQHVKDFEAGFIQQYNSWNKPFSVSNPKRFFKKHKRQYLGYLNNNGDSIILTQFVDRGTFFNFTRRSTFSGWKEDFILCLSDYCYKYLSHYEFSLTRQRLETP